MSFRITVESAFRRRLQKKTPNQQGAILECIEQLSNDPRHPGLKTSRVQGQRDVWEARIDKSNRLTWKYGDSDEIVLLNNCSHDDVYRR